MGPRTARVGELEAAAGDPWNETARARSRPAAVGKLTRMAARGLEQWEGGRARQVHLGGGFIGKRKRPNWKKIIDLGSSWERETRKDS